MAISFSRPDPSSPAAVAEAAFGTARRGFDQQEVRDFLRMVSAELGRLQERERFLERELRAAQSAAAPSSTPVIDDETATRLLGEEAARILQTAREGSNAIRAKAEEAAARMLREAADESQRLREDADLESSRRRTDAVADAEAELAMAKQQGREMVEEARAYRERVLGELSRRRDLAREQIEQLVHGRDRLLQAFERARLVAVDVVAEITPLGGPDEYVDLTPTTGPIPIMVPTSGIGDASSIDDNVLLLEVVDLPDPVDVMAIVEALVEDAADADAAMFDQDAEPADTTEVDERPDATVVQFPTPAEDIADIEEPDADDVADATEPAADVADVESHHGEDVVDAELVVDGTTEPDVVEPAGIDVPTELDGPPGDDEIDDDDVTATDVDDLFARLRAGGPTHTDDIDDLDDIDIDADPSADTDAHPSADTDLADSGLAETGESAFRQRDAALVPLIVASARKLKRVLADEQNEVLDALRRREPVRSLDDVVPLLDEQGERYADAITPELVAAAIAGAASVSATTEIDIGPGGPLSAVRASLASGLVGPLRERLERSVIDGDGDNDAIAKRVRSVYREWKTQHIDEQLDDLFRLAHGRGAFDALAPGTAVRWTVDPDGPSCPDCEDNSLAGAVPIGDAFPTGHLCPPSHAGCRCHLSPDDQ